MHPLIQRAMQLAKNSDHRCQIGCVLTNKRGDVISQGFNRLKTHPKQAHYAKMQGNIEKIYLHAEISALVKCRETPYAIYVGRVMKDGTAGMCKPCPCCEYAIRESGVKVVVYTDSIGEVKTIEL